jgi:hypothetical protein
MSHRRLPLLAAALFTCSSTYAITIGGGGDAKEVDLSQTFDLAADRAAAAKTYVVARGTPKGIKRVAIGSFCVGAVYGKGVSGTSSGGTLSFSKSAVGGFPGGLPGGELTLAAEAMRQQLEASFTAAGIEVVPYEQLSAMPTFQKFAQRMVTEPQLVDEDLDLGNSKGKDGKALLVVFSPGQRPFLKDCRNQNPGTLMAKAKLAFEKEMAGINLVSAVVTMDFAKPLAGGGFFSGAKADLKYGQFIAPGITNNNLEFTGTGGGTLWLKQAIVAAQNPFTEGGKGAVRRKGEYDWLRGTSTRTTEQSTTIDADHELWAANANSLMKALAEMYVAALTAAK